MQCLSQVSVKLNINYYLQYTFLQEPQLPIINCYWYLYVVGFINTLQRKFS